MNMAPFPDTTRYSYLWDSEYPNWALLEGWIDGTKEFLIVNVVSREVLLVSNSALKKAICDEMLKHGCRIVDSW
jgi:hypothetical protein